MGVSTCWVRNSRGTETTSASYWRTQTHETQSFLIALLETQKKRTFDTNQPYAT